MLTELFGQGVQLLAGLADLSLLRSGFLQMHKRQKLAPSILAALEEEATAYEALRETFFVDPAVIRPRLQQRRALAGGTVYDMTWQSGYEARHAPIRERYASYTPNQTASARWFRHKSPRPAVVCLHGYRGGNPTIEEYAFSAKWFYEIGLDVLLFTLPFHGARLAIANKPPIFPSVMAPWRTNEGFGQTIYDVRGLLRYLLGEGVPSVGVMGMSLGGYSAAVAATVEPQLAFSAQLIPFASFSSLVWEHGKGTAERQQAAEVGITQELLARLFLVHTPLLRAPAISGDRVFIAAGAVDKITPSTQAEQLREHFGAREFHLFPGGHLLQFGRKEVFRSLAKFLARHQLLAARDLAP
jgi:dienelactone hydrolase